VFLAKERQIDTAKEPVIRDKHILGPGQQGKISALQMAQQTADVPIGGGIAKRSTAMITVATRGRNLLRERKSSLTYKYVKPPKEKQPMAARKGGVQLDEADLAALQAEVEEEDRKKEERALLGEGEEGEEGAYDDDYGYGGGGGGDDDMSEDSGYFGRV